MEFELEKFGSVELLNYCSLSDKDILRVLAMRNSPDIRCWMYNQAEISESEHLAYIEKLKKDSTKKYFVVVYQEQWVGTINFVEIDEKLSSCSFGMFANPSVKLLGIGRILEQVCIDYAFKILQLNVMNLEVMVGNKQVINLHRKYGFEITGEKSVCGHSVLVMQKKRVLNEN